MGIRFGINTGFAGAIELLGGYGRAPEPRSYMVEIDGQAYRAVETVRRMSVSEAAALSGQSEAEVAAAANAGKPLSTVSSSPQLRVADGGTTIPIRTGLATHANEAVFWSGIRNGETTAAQWASQNAGVTLESSVTVRGIRLPAWDPANNASVAAWRQASEEFAAGASGHVRVLQGDLVRIKSVWAEVEFPALRANPNVTSITGVDPATGQELLLWAR